MSISALFGDLFNYWTQSWLIGVLGALLIGVLLGLLMGFFSLKLKTDIILSGVAVNLLGAGGTIFHLYMFTDMRRSPAAMPMGLLVQKAGAQSRHIPALHASIYQ